MQKILAIIWKDLIIRFSSPAEWLFFIVLPVVFTVVLGGGTGSPSDNRIRLAVVNQAGTPLAADLLGELEKSQSVRPEVLALATAEDQFSKRQVSTVLVIPAGFDTAQLEGGTASLEIRQQPNNLNAMVAYRAVQAVMSRVSSRVEIARASTAEAERVKPFASSAERQAYFTAALEQAQKLMASAPERLTVNKGSTKDQIEYDPRASSSAGQLITWVFIPLIGISAMFAYERQKGTLRRLLTTPSHKSVFLLGTIGGQVLMALVQMLILIIFGMVVMGLNWGHAPGALALMLVSSALAAAALGTTLGTFVKTESQANGLSIMLGMVMGLMGGCWYPIELFPQAVRSAVQVLPTTWAMQGMLDIVLRGEGAAGVLPEAGVLLGMALVLFVIGVLRFKYE